MRIVVYHSRLGAVALAAAFQHLSVQDQDDQQLVKLLRQLPNRGEFLLSRRCDDELILAAQSGIERFVLEHAIHSLTKEFRPDIEVKMHDFTAAEPPRLEARLWLARRGCYPTSSFKDLVKSLKQRVSEVKEGKQ